MSEKIDKKLDTLGLYCPEPVFKVRLTLDEMKVGEILEVKADDPAAESDIQSLIKHLEQQLISITKDDDVITFLIKKIK